MIIMLIIINVVFVIIVIMITTTTFIKSSPSLYYYHHQQQHLFSSPLFSLSEAFVFTFPDLSQLIRPPHLSFSAIERTPE